MGWSRSAVLTWLWLGWADLFFGLFSALLLSFGAVLAACVLSFGAAGVCQSEQNHMKNPQKLRRNLT